MVVEILQPWTSETSVPFVCGLVDPEYPKHVRYVGMAPVKASRPYKHAREARNSLATTHKFNWIRKVQSEGREPAVLVLESLAQGAPIELLGFIEKCYIKSLRAIGHNLTNASEGGRGRSGPLSLEARANMAIAAHVRWQDPAEREKARLGSLGRVTSEDTKEKLHDARVAYLTIPGTREEIGNASRGRKRSPEAIVKLSNSMLGNTNGLGSTHTPEERERIRRRVMGNQNCLGRVHKEASKEQCRETNIATWSAPERRAAHSALMKASWARRRAAKNV